MDGETRSGGMPLDNSGVVVLSQFDTAYRIAYSLLGDRAEAIRIATSLDIEHRVKSEASYPNWLVPIAEGAWAGIPDQSADEDSLTSAGHFGPEAEMPDPESNTGEASVGDPKTSDDERFWNPETSGAAGDFEHRTLREATRRRLSSCSRSEQVAAMLTHLAEVPISDVATAMGESPQRVSELAAVLAPGPGVKYSVLADPIAEGSFQPVIRTRRSNTKKRVLLVVGVLLVLALGGLGLSFANKGESTTPIDNIEVVASDDVAVLPSAGCATDASASAPNESSSEEQPSSSSTEPKPLVVGLPGYGQTAEQFAEKSGLSIAEGEVIRIDIDPPEPQLEFNTVGDPNRRDDRALVVEETEEELVNNCVDVNRVHLVGFGSGGQLGGLVACANPNLYASVTMVAGWLMAPDCELDPAVSALFLANTDDPVIQPGGGYGNAAGFLYSETPIERPESLPMQDVASSWAKAIEAESPPQTDYSGDTLTELWSAPGGSDVTLVLRPEGGHRWDSTDVGLILPFMAEHAREATVS